MGQRTQNRQLPALPMSYDHPHHIQDISDENVANLVDDVLGGGLINWDADPNSPLDLSVLITITNGWSMDGKRLQLAQTEVDLTSLVPVSGYTWVSIWAVFAWSNADTVMDGNGNLSVPSRTESVTLSATAGASNVLPVNPGGGAVRVCSVRLHSSTATITSAMIKVTGAYADEQVTIPGCLPLAGGKLTGGVLYDHANGMPLSFCNHGKGILGKTISQFGDEGDPSLNFNYYLTINAKEMDDEASIKTGIVSNNLTFDLRVKMKVYDADSGAIADAWVVPDKMRFSADQVGAFSEQILRLFEEDASGNFTGNVYLFIIGSFDYVSRFTGRPFRWTATAPMPIAGSI